MFINSQLFVGLNLLTESPHMNQYMTILFKYMQTLIFLIRTLKTCSHPSQHIFLPPPTIFFSADEDPIGRPFSN